jgi:hypothetical protein
MYTAKVKKIQMHSPMDPQSTEEDEYENKWCGK